MRREDELALEWAQTIQFELARALMEKKRLTLGETFTLLGASMNLTEYVKDKSSPLTSTEPAYQGPPHQRGRQ